MACALRVGAGKILARNNAAGLCKTALGSRANVIQIQVACITGKAMRVTPLVRPKPYPYETKPYNLWNSLWDKTSPRMDENSKIILVEGPIASGKTAFAEVLADQLDMKYMPAVTMDMEYINAYGYDMRQLDHKLPESCKSYDVEDFCKNPNHMNCAGYQILMYKHRFAQYVDALAHLFSTGEGIVMERSCYSDIVFTEVMYKAGYISKLAYETYRNLRGLTIGKVLLPHLIVYLDVPAAIVKEKIQKRGIPYEVQSKVFTAEYLENMEYWYKQQYLKTMSEHAHILIYDWTDGGDPEVVIEDIERLNFDVENEEGKFKDWQFWDETNLCETRQVYADCKLDLMNNFNLGQCDAPELNISGDDYKILVDTWMSAPGNRYMRGFNADMGDKGLLWKGASTLREYRTTTVD